MTIITTKLIKVNEWIVYSSEDFRIQFKEYEQEAIKVVEKELGVEENVPLYDYGDDHSFIESVLEKSKRKYLLTFFEKNNGYWVIKEVF